MDAQEANDFALPTLAEGNAERFLLSKVHSGEFRQNLSIGGSYSFSWQQVRELLAAHSAQVEAELYSARSDRDMQIEVRHRVEAELVKLREEVATAKRYGQTEYGIEQLLRSGLAEAREREAKLREALKEIRGHSITFDLDEIPHIASEALGETVPEEKQ
jgi:hypothetical protein